MSEPFTTAAAAPPARRGRSAPRPVASRPTAFRPPVSRIG